MASDSLLTELERQEKYLAQLPTDYPFPLFNSKQALESQRRNGYRNTAAAAREIVDNAIEAGATKIHVVFDRPKRQKGQRGKTDSISAVAFIDNGSGMLPLMARYALSWGGGTHFEESTFIGKFGFGLPNASINQTRRVEVYTRTISTGSITKAWLDINNVQKFGLHTIEEPIPAELPEFVQQYLDQNGFNFDHGTVVVWVTPDRLTYRTGASLKEHLLDDFGVTYRYLLDRFELKVEGTPVDSVDPLFLDPNARYYLPQDQGGAIEVTKRVIPVKYYCDPETGALHLDKLEDSSEIRAAKENIVAVGSIALRVARFPMGLVGRKVQVLKYVLDEKAPKRFEIRQTRRGMSFVRADREIETVDAFPRSSRDIASGLGRWPLLQSYAYHWGVEVKFSPELDEVFGITNDKQRVRPIEDFWKLLASKDYEFDRILRNENDWQREQRKKQMVPVEPSDEPSPAEQAASTVSTITGRPPRIPNADKPEIKQKVRKEAEQRSALTGKSIEEAEAAIEEESRRRPYRIDYYDEANGPFYEPRWELGNRILVRVNRKHPFYRTFYNDLLQLPGGMRAKYSIDVFLIALAKGELELEDPIAKLWFKEQRTKQWSTFLENALQVLEESLETHEEVEENFVAAD